MVVRYRRERAPPGAAGGVRERRAVGWGPGRSLFSIPLSGNPADSVTSHLFGPTLRCIKPVKARAACAVTQN